EILPREAHVLAIALDRVDLRRRRAMGEPQRGIAERAAELEHARGRNRGGDHTEDGAVLEGIGAAAVLGAVTQGLGAHLRERIERLLLSHGKTRDIRRARYNWGSRA